MKILWNNEKISNLVKIMLTLIVVIKKFNVLNVMKLMYLHKDIFVVFVKIIYYVINVMILKDIYIQ